MRIFISIALYILAVGLGLLGVAERTIWAPDVEKKLSITIDESQPLVVIPNSILKLNPGKPVVNVTGHDEVFIATGRESDVKAWVGASSSDTVTLDKKSKKLLAVEQVSTVASANPAGSDLWRTERSAVKHAAAKVDTSHEGALLIASDGISSAPNQISITWTRDVDLTWSNTLIISSIALLFITLIYNIIVYRNIRNSRRPRRRLPRAPQGPRLRRRRRESSLPKRGRRVAGREFAVIPATILTFAMLTGCATGSAPTPTPTASTGLDTLKPASLQLGQIRRIVTQVAAVAKKADEANNATGLLSRFVGPALEIRQSAYSLIKKSKKAPALETISASPLTLSLPEATDTWPRTLMVVTGVQKDKLPILMVLEQSEPRRQYMVTHVSTLISGVKLPEVPAVKDGGIAVKPDSAYLQLQPLLLSTTYGNIIDAGSASPDYGKFALSGDTFYKQISQIEKDQVATLTKATLTYQHLAGDAAPISLATADGGALVAVYMKDLTTIKPKKRNSGITVNELEQVALGAKGSLKGVVSTYGDMLMFYVPPVGSEEKIRLLGWQSYLLKVKSL
ncbi:MAG: hypothetical protein RL140_490 [Actinomycetota bacterium]|jgi:hypothetical protein